MRSEEFAQRRGSRLDQADRELLPVVQAALQHWTADGDWVEDIVTGASVLWRELFEESHPNGDGATEDRLEAQFQQVLRETLAHTSDPSGARDDQPTVVTEWVSTFTANNAEHRAAQAGEHPRMKWVTRHDSRVRALHVPMDGVTIESGTTFDLGHGVHLAHPGEPIGPPEYWIRCRCLVQRVGRGTNMAGNATAFTEETVVAAADAPQAVEDDQERLTPEDLVDTPQPTPFHGVAAPTDTPSGDGRQLAKAGFSARNLPLPLNYQKGSYHGGDPGPAVTVGRIDAVWVDDETGLVHYEGQFSPNIPEAGDAIQHIVDGTMRGVSVDVDNAELQVPSDDDEEFGADLSADLAIFKSWRIAGITMVAIPAFQEANIQLGPHPQGQGAMAAAAVGYFAPGTHDGPGWLTDPVDTERIRKYWITGKGRAKIAWGVDGDFDRCRAHLGKYVEPQYLAGTCANMHKEATGFWPGHAPGETAALNASLVAAGARMAAAINLVAAVEAPTLPSTWFEDPHLDEPTPFTVRDDGHVYGHVATWGTCHIGYSGVCTTAPESFTNYAYFRTGAVRTDAGDVAVGHITMDAGHAPMRAGGKAAAAHYDNTAAVVADVAAGEDPYGIWIAGAIRPGLPEEKIRALKAAALSGDWRSIGGHLEMIAALAVNVPGFPIPRTSLAASGEHQESLTAAGIVTKENTTMADMTAPPAPAHDAAPAAPKPEAPKVDPEIAKAIAAIDAAIDAAMGAGNPDPNVAKADTLIDQLMMKLGIPDPDEQGEPAAPPAHKEAAPAPMAASAADVTALVRREMQIAARRDQAKAKIQAVRVERAKRFVR